MTTEPPGTPEPTPADPIVPQTVTTSPMSNMSGKSMVMIASAVVVGVYLIFGLIANEWFPSDEALIAATLALVLSRIEGTPIGSGIGTGSLMKLAGYVIAVAGLWDFIETLRFGWGGAEDVIAWVLLAGAAVLAFLGARSIQT